MRGFRTEEKPVLLGYHTVRVGAVRSEEWRTRRSLLKYAQREGFRLGQIYVHDEAAGEVQELIRERLKQRAGVEIRVVGR